MLALCSLQCELLHQNNLYIAANGLCKRMQHWPTTPNIVLLNAVHVASVYTPCCMLLGIVVGKRLKPVKLLSQLPPTFILFCDPRSLAKQCWVRLHSSFDHCWGHASI